MIKPSQPQGHKKCHFIINIWKVSLIWYLFLSIENIKISHTFYQSFFILYQKCFSLRSVLLKRKEKDLTDKLGFITNKNLSHHKKSLDSINLYKRQDSTLITLFSWTTNWEILLNYILNYLNELTVTLLIIIVIASVSER